MSFQWYQYVSMFQYINLYINVYVSKFQYIDIVIFHQTTCPCARHTMVWTCLCKHTISYHVIPFIDQLKEENQNCIPINWKSIRCYATVSNNIKIWQGLQRVILISLVCLFLLFRAIWSMKNLHWRFIFDAQSSLRTVIWTWRLPEGTLLKDLVLYFCISS